MQRALALAVLGLALVAGPTTAQDAPGEAEAAAMATAKANQALVKVKPRWVSGEQPAFPEAEKALGHHGVVKVSGILGADGRMSQTEVALSSGAPVLDALALASVKGALFQPAKDAAGVPIPLAINVPVEFYSYKSAGPGGGILRYSCGQFACDMDWWRATFPKAELIDHELYATMRGIAALAQINSGRLDAAAIGSFNEDFAGRWSAAVMAEIRSGRLDAAAIKAGSTDFARRWSEAIETCRSHPERRFTQVLQPEGRIAEALAKPK